MSNIVPIEKIEKKIYLIRGLKVMIDSDLAALYEVGTRDLNKAVTRNLDRFPEDFMFQLTKMEFRNLMFQIGTSKWGGTRKLPRVFSEQGVAMLSSILRSKRAILVNIQIMRTFVRIKQFFLKNKELEQKLNILEEKYGKHLKKHDEEIQMIFEAIRKMLVFEEKPKRKIGFGGHNL